jgi:hypothetical protein
MAFDLNPFFTLRNMEIGPVIQVALGPFPHLFALPFIVCASNINYFHYLYDTILIGILFSFLRMENKGLDVLINLGPAPVFASRLDSATCASGAPGHLVN